jgi:hypothetical protein
MLHEFVTANRTELIKRCREKVAKRSPQIPAGADQGVPLFLSQLVDILRREQSTGTSHTPDPEPTPAPTDIGRGAALHGADMLQRGYSVDQVVHDYGDVCQAVTELAVELKKPVNVEEFRTLNRCLDNAIADAVTAYARGQNESITGKAKYLDKRDSNLVDEQLRLIDSAMQTFAAIKTGSIGLKGATGTLHSKYLLELRNLTIQSRPETARVLGTIALLHR